MTGRKSEQRQRTAIVSFRVTPSELAAIETQAGDVPLSIYLRGLALAETPCETCNRQPPPGFICSGCGRQAPQEQQQREGEAP